MPLEWELKRARQMIADLKPEIEVNAKRIAREKVEVARLQKDLGETDERLAKTQADIERLSEDLRSDNQYYTYAGRTYTSAQVKNDLGNRFKRFKTRRATAEKLQQMLTARESSLKSAQERMEAMFERQASIGSGSGEPASTCRCPASCPDQQRVEPGRQPAGANA